MDVECFGCNQLTDDYETCENIECREKLCKKCFKQSTKNLFLNYEDQINVFHKYKNRLNEMDAKLLYKDMYLTTHLKKLNCKSCNNCFSYIVRNMYDDYKVLGYDTCNKVFELKDEYDNVKYKRFNSNIIFEYNPDDSIFDKYISNYIDIIKQDIQKDNETKTYNLWENDDKERMTFVVYNEIQKCIDVDDNK